MNSQTVRNSLITALVHFDGYGKIFPQIVGELSRIDKLMPNGTKEEKLEKFEADAKIIFDDIVLPIGGYVFNALIGLGLIYLRGINPVAADVADSVGHGIQAAVTEATTQ